MNDGRLLTPLLAMGAFSLWAAACATHPFAGAPSPPRAAAGSSPAVTSHSVPSPREMRTPWQRGDDRFIREWLVLGQIPLPSPPASDDDAQRALGFDDLAADGGEAAIRPVAGMKARRLNGVLQWLPESSWTDAVDWTEPFPASTKENWIAYAYTTVHRSARGKAVLSVGSDDAVRIWLNGGLVHNGNLRRHFVPDEDRIDVDMDAGDNRLLVKVVHRSGSSQFAVRVLERGTLLSRNVEIGPSIVESETTAHALVVKTDVAAAGPSVGDVTVEVIRAGGVVVAGRVAPRGARVSFDPSAWPDGAYEIRCTTRTISGHPWAVHLPWYKGNALLAAKRLLQAADAADGSRPDGFTLKMLGALVRDRLGGPVEQVDGNPWGAIHSPLLEFEELALEAASPRARVRPYGFVRLAYRDEVDGSPQFCRSYLPAGYDPSAKWPMVVYLHGYDPSNPKYVNWENVDSRRPSFGDNTNVIVVEPHGRGNAWYLGFGELDVLKCIQLAKERFRVDDDRVYLTGESMGGGGAWQIGSSHPELFAAIAPTFGGWDYHVQLDEEALAKLSPVQRFFRERESSFARAESLVNVPVFVHHGDSDHTVDVEGSRYAVRMLERWGYDVRYREHPGRGHEDLKVSNEIIDWFLQHKREAEPSRVRIRSAELSSAASYWVKVERSERPLSFIHADAAIVGPNTVRLDTENVAEVELGPTGHLIDSAKPLRVVWNGAPARSVDVRDGRALLRAQGYVPATLEKTPSMAGPLFDVFRTPFAVVIGTTSTDAAMREQCQKKGQDFLEFWQRWQHERPRVFRDSEITDADAARFSVVLIGGPDENRLAKRLGSSLPLRVSPTEIAVDGHSFPVHDAVVQLIYPSPLNPARYVLVVAATSAEGLYFWFPDNGRIGDRSWDFLVRDGRDASTMRTPLSDDMRVVSGVFDQKWRYNEAFVVRGDADLRQRIRVTHAPKATLLDSGALDEYVGRYRLSPEMEVSVTRGEGRLVVQVGQLGPRQAVPQGEDAFFLQGINARVGFERDAAHRVVSLTLRFPGEELKAVQVP